MEFLILDSCFYQRVKKNYDQLLKWLVKAVVRGFAGDKLAPPEFRVSEKRTEREIDSLLLSAQPDLKIERQLWILHNVNHEGAVKFHKNF